MANKIVDYIKLLTMIKEGKIVEGTTIKRYEGRGFMRNLYFI